MDAGGTSDLIHEILGRTFAELGATGPIIRTLLLRDRRFAGQKFRCEGYHAVLSASNTEIEFFDEDGGAADDGHA